MSCCEVVADGLVVGAIPSWAQTLVVGNVSGGRNPSISSTDSFLFLDVGGNTRGQFDSRTVTTPGAATTTAWNFTLPDNTAAFVNAIVVAMQDDGSNRKFFHINVGVFRDGGIATIQGVAFDTFVPYGTAALALATATFDVDGVNDVRVRVTGIAATNIIWTVQPQLVLSR